MLLNWSYISSKDKNVQKIFFTKQTSKNKLADHLPLIIADESDNESVTNTSLDSDKENESIILKLNAITPAITNILNESFQKVDVDIVQAQEWVKMSVKCLSEMKLAENFAIFYKSVLEMVSENNIENETKNGRKRGRMSIVETRIAALKKRIQQLNDIDVKLHFTHEEL